MNIFADTFVGTESEFVLKNVFGYDSFRAQQKEIIQSVLDGKDTLAIMPTGGGKSICYQVPALILPGVTIVVSPLISLMQDQVASLKAAGIQAVFLNSTLDLETFRQTAADIKAGQIKIIYVSPEGLATNRIRDIFSNVTVSCITVDEAHCLSAWGHDFRVEYLEIGAIRHYFADAVMIALTATATEQVRLDILKNLHMKTPNVFISSFDRPNIFLEVQAKKNGTSQVIDYISHRKDQSGIIYCYSRKSVDDLTETLQDLGYSVLNYHAGLTDEVRANNQTLFVKDEVQIMVATIAFGMGIDKPNVRYVINYDLPKSIEEFYQQIGRAGRDGLPSSSLLLYSPGDITKIRYFFDDVANPQQAEALLQKMISFAASKECRRKNLLEYFGETFTPPEDQETKNCCCDICVNGAPPLTDVTIPVQKLLCCMIRTQQRFGANYVIDVLLGSHNKRILENGHNMISTFNIGNELSKDDWLELVDLLISDNYIQKTGEYKILTLTYKGEELLATREHISLPIRIHGKGKLTSFPKATSQSPQYVLHKKTQNVVAEQPSAGDTEAERIITELKAWRKRKADDMNIAPYQIFGDKTVLDLAAKKPSNKSELLNIYGIGRAKAEEYGKAILRIVTNSN